MRIARLIRSLGFIIVMIFSSISSVPNARSAETQALVEGNTAFALDLYAQLKATPGNLFFSPYSISTCLALTYAGARGNAEKQMAQVLHFTQDQSQLHASFGELQRRLNETGTNQGPQLNIANALWAQEGHPFLPDFLRIAQDEYQANVKQIDFKTGADAATREINQWVAEKTKDKIQNILPPGSVDALTRLVLANAIYFKGVWAKPFEKTATTNQPFHISPGRQVDAPLMHHLDEVKYMETNEFQAVELPYSSNQLSMVVLLPPQIDGCVELEKRLTPALLSKSIAGMRRQKVELFLPRFKLESSFELNQPLAKIGMQDAFGPKADFSGMDGSRLLYISAVFHKAWGEINEEGTEAAAATVTGMRALSVVTQPAQPPIFRADHPFLFLIRDVRSGSLMFLGRLIDPTK